MPAPNTPQSAPAPTPPADPPTPPEALSAEEIRALVAEQVRAALGDLGKTVAPIVNAAVTNHLKRLPDRGAPPPDGAPPPPPDGGSGAQAANAKVQAEIAALRAQVEASEKGRREAERKAQVDAVRRRVADGLAAKGITGAKQRAVLADLESSGRLRVEEDGTVLLTVERARVKGAKAAPLEHRDLAEGLDDWAQTDDAREFLPAPGAAAAGGARPARMPVNGQPKKFDLTTEEGAVAAASALLDNQ